MLCKQCGMYESKEGACDHCRQDWDATMKDTSNKLSSTPPNILDVIRTLRKERDWPFSLAKDTAIEMFRERGWPIPPSIERLYNFQQKL
jgi:hypothetical protein